MPRFPKSVDGLLVQSDANVYELERVLLGIYSVSPLVLDVDGLKVATALLATETTLTTFNAPDVPRNVSITLTETAADVSAVQAVVNGTDMAGNVIAETMPVFTVDTLGTVVGSKIFATVTSVVIPAMDGTGVEASIGFEKKIGIPSLAISQALKPIQVSATAITITASLTALESNYFVLDAGSFDGSEHQVLMYLQK